MIKVGDGSNGYGKKLNLTPDQVNAIQPLLQEKYIYIDKIKDVYMASDKSDSAKKTARDSPKTISDKYNAKIAAIFSRGSSHRAWRIPVEGAASSFEPIADVLKRA